MLQPGDRIGRYEIQRRLGRGGMGTVYVAHDPKLGRLVALKMFAGDLDADDAAEKFSREARAAAALNHTNIVTIHDFGEFESQPFIVMEYIQGDTLARVIRKKADLSLSERLRLIEDLCAGVAYAHGYDVIHRDIKPANLMIDRANRLKVLDFGIARMLGTSLSKGTALIGTPGYMAPEQIRGGVIDRRSDLFSIGVVTYELLSYVEAFPGDSVPAITHRILTEEPLPLGQLVEDLPDELVVIVERALKKNPADRYDDAASMGAAIAKVRAQADGDPRFATLRPTLQGSQVPRRSASGTGASNLTPGPISSNAAATPSGDTPRQAQLARKRTEQIDRALAKARAELHEGRLQDAHETCLEALSLSETHPGALQLEKEIDVALAQKRARELVAEGRAALDRGALTQAEGAVRDARELDSTSIDVRQLERDLRIRRVEHAESEALAESVRQALQRGHAALERSDLEAALTAARQARRLDPSSEDARRLEAEALRLMDLETGVGETIAGYAVTADAPTVVVPSGAKPAPPPAHTSVAAEPLKPVPAPKPAPKPAPAAPPATAAALARFWASTQTQATRAGRTVTVFTTVTVAQALRSAGRSMSQATTRAWAQLGRARPRGSEAPVPPSRRLGGRTAILVWSAAGVIVVAGAGLASWLYLRPAPPAKPVTGSVTIDALPWAAVTSIVGADDQRVTLPEDPSTPLTITLPVGVYRVTLTGPQAGAAPLERTVTVVDGQTVTIDDVKFSPLSTEAYFNLYLASHQEPVASDGAGSGSVEAVSAKAREETR